MFIKSLLKSARQRFEAHRRYRRVVAEIATLSQDDLIDIGAFQIDLYRAARTEILG